MQLSNPTSLFNYRSISPPPVVIEPGYLCRLTVHLFEQEVWRIDLPLAFTAGFPAMAKEGFSMLVMVSHPDAHAWQVVLPKLSLPQDLLSSFSAGVSIKPPGSHALLPAWMAECPSIMLTWQWAQGCWVVLELAGLSSFTSLALLVMLSFPAKWILKEALIHFTEKWNSFILSFPVVFDSAFCTALEDKRNHKAQLSEESWGCCLPTCLPSGWAPQRLPQQLLWRRRDLLATQDGCLVKKNATTTPRKKTSV